MKKSTAAGLAGTITLLAALAAWLYLTSPSYRSAKLEREIAALERAVAADAAELLVERAECATTAVRYGQALADTCWQIHGLQVKMAAEHAQSAHRRIAKLKAERDALR